MGRREIIKQELIEDIHIQRKKENRARSINKAQSELMILEEEREIKKLQRKARKNRFKTYQEMSTFMGGHDEDDII